MISLLPNRLCSCIFNFFNSTGTILYEVFDIGVMPRARSIVKFTSHSSENPWMLSKNTSKNSLTTSTSFGFVLSYMVMSTTVAKYPSHHLFKSFVAFTIEMMGYVVTYFLDDWLPIGWKVIVFLWQSMDALYFVSQSMTRTISKSLRSIINKSASLSFPSTAIG